MNFLKIAAVLALVGGGAFVSCVGLQNRTALERNIASQNYGANATLAKSEQFTLETEDRYLSKIQPIFNNRCITCHSCFNSPCQLNMTSFAGVDRGAIQDDIYEKREVGNKSPTRLGVDVPQSYDWETITGRWRENKFVGAHGTYGFFPIVNRTPQDPSARLASSILAQLIALKSEYSSQHSLTEQFNKPFAAEQSRICPINSKSAMPVSDQLRSYQNNLPWAGMPYGFPKLSPEETSEIFNWIKEGAKPPVFNATYQLSKPSKPATVQEWESFLNQGDFSHRITARYIYEHLFLAHVYFDEMPGEFFRLIRAHCDNDGGNCHELPTRRPTDDPKSSEYYFENSAYSIFYKFQKVTSAIVHKAHIPFQLNTAKLDKWKKMFIEQINNKKNFPAYGNETGGNPFLTFKEIPPKSRYQFLIDDSYFFINSFIKGPVCRGSEALSVIDDHFWVFFIKPDSDVTLQHPEFFADAGDNLAVPASDGNDWTLIELFKQKRRSSRSIKKDYLNKYLKSGFSLQDIWTGEGDNPNAVLTIYRHQDSASVSRGALGEIPKTMWMLDYPIFEDIYYNLVGTYDVYAPIVHAVKTRLHMDASRFNSQDMYLGFLPAKFRMTTRAGFSRDRNLNLLDKVPTCSILPAELCAFYSQSAGTMRDIVYPYSGPEVDSQIAISDSENPQGELAEKILNYLPEKVTHFTSEHINKKKTDAERGSLAQFSRRTDLKFSEVENILSVIGGKKGIFASYLPELSFVQIVDSDNLTVAWYTMIHNRERYNVAFFEQIAPERDRLWPERDSVNFVKGFVGSYANAIYSVPLKRLPEFVGDINSLRDTLASFQKLNKKFLVSRHNPNFWKYFDNMSYFSKQQGITAQSDKFEGSLTDLNRYINDVGF